MRNWHKNRRSLDKEQREIAETGGQVERFLAANKKSKIMSAAVIGEGGEGAIYTLEDGSRHELNSRACKIIGMPDWKI